MNHYHNAHVTTHYCRSIYRVDSTVDTSSVTLTDDGWQFDTYYRYYISALSRISPRVRVRDRPDSVSIVYRIAPGGYSWIWPYEWHYILNLVTDPAGLIPVEAYFIIIFVLYISHWEPRTYWLCTRAITKQHHAHCSDVLWKVPHSWDQLRAVVCAIILTAFLNKYVHTYIF